MNVPQRCIDVECPLATQAKGFALFSGALPPKSGIAILMEAADVSEPSFLVRDLPDGPAEVARRQKYFPELEEKYTKIGAPAVGRSGALLWQWVLRAANLQRSDIFIANTLACFCGRTPDGGVFYPIGNVRKRAEATCAETWLQPLLTWDPTVSVVGMHPSGLSGDITPLPVVIRAVEKCKMFAARGERVLLLMGGKAAHHWLGYASNTTRWCGHWQAESEFTRRKRAERWSSNRRLSVEKKVKKVKALTLKQEVIALLSQQEPQEIQGKLLYTMYLGEDDRNRILALCETKAKKTKVEVV